MWFCPTVIFPCTPPFPLPMRWLWPYSLALAFLLRSLCRGLPPCTAGPVLHWALGLPGVSVQQQLLGLICDSLLRHKGLATGFCLFGWSVCYSWLLVPRKWEIVLPVHCWTVLPNGALDSCCSSPQQQRDDRENVDVSDLIWNFLKGLYHCLSDINALTGWSGALRPHLSWVGFPGDVGLTQLCQPFSPVPGEQPGL